LINRMKKFKNKYRIESNRLQGWYDAASALHFAMLSCKIGHVFLMMVK